MPKISCIIPAYNEFSRIAGVLRVVASHSMIAEVLVIDDGSTDHTKDIVASFKNVRLFVQPRNMGKSAAIYKGVKEAAGEFLLFLDSDLVGLNEQNISDLINPILSHKADVSLSLRENAPKLWHFIGIDYIAGERVFLKRVLEPHLEEILLLPKFGLEVFLNRLIIKNKLRIKIVSWPNVKSPFKYKKYGWFTGVKGDVRMMLDIFKTISILGPIYQIIKMMKQRV